MVIYDYKDEPINLDKYERMDCISHEEFNAVIDYMKKKITDKGITIKKFLVLPGYHYSGYKEDKEHKGVNFFYEVGFEFWGIDPDGVVQVYMCTSDIEGFCTVEHLENTLGAPYSEYNDNNPRIKLTKKPKNIKLNAEIKFPEPIHSMDDIIYMSSSGKEIIYMRENFDWKLEYLRFKWYGDRYDIVNHEEIDMFVNDDGVLYVHPCTSCDEEDLEKSPYIQTEATEEDIASIKKRIVDTNTKKGYVAIAYKEYCEVEKTNDFLIYRVFDTYSNRNYYSAVLKSNVICGNTPDKLWQTNSHVIDLDGEIEGIYPIIFDTHETNYYGTKHCCEYVGDNYTVSRYSDETLVEMDDNSIYEVVLKDGRVAILVVEPKQPQSDSACKRIVLINPRKKY